MKTRVRKPIAFGAALLLAAALLGTAVAPALASGATRASKSAGRATTAAHEPEPGVTGCDVLLSAPVGHDCLLPWPIRHMTCSPLAESTKSLQY